MLDLLAFGRTSRFLCTISHAEDGASNEQKLLVYFISSSYIRVHLEVFQDEDYDCD